MNSQQINEIQEQMDACEKEINQCLRLLNKGMTSDRYGQIFEKKRSLEAKMFLLQEQFGMRNQLTSHEKSNS